MDTIFSPATAPGKAGVAIVRISGPDAEAAGRALAGSLPPARTAGLRRLHWREEVLDEALVLWFEAGRSFTGEAVVELHLHGAQAVVQAVLGALANMPGLRIAEPGEFTRRALENGRLDLTQVEGLADLIDAETEAQRKQALRVVGGAVGDIVEAWRGDLLRAAALLEAVIDFSDEDIPIDVLSEAEQLILRVTAAIAKEREGLDAAERVREGFEVAIIGRPNSGKSTLLNMLAGREAAITSEYAGTTRDVIEVRMDIGGLAITLLDTAGLREADNPVEAIGIERAVKRAEASDLRIFLLDDEDVPILRPRSDDIVAQGKADLWTGPSGLAVSGKTGQGIEELVAAIGERFSVRARSAGVMTRARHRVGLDAALKALESARLALGDQVEIAADELRRAIRALEAVVGKVDAEQMLGEIFSSFCIGK